MLIEPLIGHGFMVKLGAKAWVIIGFETRMEEVKVVAIESQEHGECPLGMDVITTL